MDSPRTILRTIKSAKKILIPFHLRPDGDMIGSALAVDHILRKLGKRAELVSTDPLPEAYFFLPGSRRIRNVDPGKMDLSRFDLILLVDNADRSRFSHQKIEFPPQAVLINIDHHESNREYGDLNYVVPAAASAAEVIYDLIRTWKIPLDSEIANCLLTGIYTDTGGFIYSTTTPESLAKSSELIRQGADRAKVVQQAFRSWPPTALAIWSAILANARVRGKVVHSQLSFKVLKKIKRFKKEELSSIRSFATANLLLGIKGIKAALLFTEEEPRQIRVTLRSSGNPNVSRIAVAFGGGGHAAAAAFDFQGTIRQAQTKTLKLVKIL